MLGINISFNMGMQNPMMGGGMGMMGGGMGMPGMGGMGMPGMGGMGCMGGMGGQNPMMMMQMMMQMLQMMMQMMQMMMGGGCSPMMGGMDGMGGMGMPGMGGGMGMPGMGGGFSPALGNNLGNFLGMPGGGYGMPGMGGMGGPVPMGSFNGNGSDAVRIGEQFLGRNSADIKGQLPHFTAAGGQTNNCADFVSSCLESTGRIQGHHINVRELEQSLIKQGYRQIPLSQAQPGDVWINNQRGHTELVTGGDGRGGVNLIGSNNDRPGHQVISRGHSNSGVVYSRR